MVIHACEPSNERSAVIDDVHISPLRLVREGELRKCWVLSARLMDG